MEEIKTAGLVIRELQVGEADKLLTILTPEHGKLCVSGKGVASLRSRHMTSAQPFSYSSFVLRRTRKYYYIADSDMIECFFNIRYDIERLALANYLCDVACDVALEDSDESELLRLMLNTLYALSNRENISNELLRAAFEFRVAVQSGYMPQLEDCGVCGKHMPPMPLLFDVMNGSLRCSDCANVARRAEMDEDRTADITFRLTPAVLETMRYIARAPLGRYLSFSLSQDELPLFSGISETYLTSHLEHGFGSLTYYKKLCRDGAV